MNQRQSWKWDAEAAFKRDEIRLSLSDARERDGEGPRADFAADAWRRLNILRDNPSVVIKHRPGWTPAPDPRAYMKAKPDVYKGRDYEALTKAALRKPVGYWEDAPRGMKFNQDIDFIEPNPPSKELREAYNQALKLFEAKIEAAVAVPTSPPPAAKKPPVGYYEDAPHGIKFGGQPLLSASTNPHGKDVDTAEMHKGERLSIPTKLIGGPERDAIVAECRKAMGI